MCKNITLKRYELEFLKKWENDKKILETTKENCMIISKLCQYNLVDTDESFFDDGYIIFYIKVYRFYFKVNVKLENKNYINPFINEKTIKDFYIEQVFPYKKVEWFSRESYISESERKSNLSTYMEVFGNDNDEPTIKNVIKNQFFNEEERKILLLDSEDE